MVDIPQVRVAGGTYFSGPSTYQYPMTGGATDGFAVRNLGTMVAQGASNPTVPGWRGSPQDFDAGLVGPRGYNGAVGRYYGSDSVEPNSSRWFGTDQTGRLNPGNMIEEIQLPPGVIRQTPGMMSNERVHYQYALNKDWLFGMSRIIERQMPLFMRTSTTNPVVMRQGLPFRTGNWEGYSTCVNLITLNYALACEAFVDAPDKTPREVCDQWVFAGAVVNATGMENSAQPMNASVVVGVKGPERMYDVWGPVKLAATPLLFIIKLIELPPYYMLDPSGQIMTTPNGGGRGLKPLGLQLIPYANNNMPEPPRSLLQYIDSEGQVCYGSTICIGRVSHRTVDGSTFDMNGAAALMSTWLSCHAMVSQPNFEVMLDAPIVTHYN